VPSKGAKRWSSGSGGGGSGNYLGVIEIFCCHGNFSSTLQTLSPFFNVDANKAILTGNPPKIIYKGFNWRFT